MWKNAQQLKKREKIQNSIIRDWRLNIVLRSARNRGKYVIHRSMEELLGKNCEMEKPMNFIKKIGLFNDLLRCYEEDENEGKQLTISKINLAMSYSFEWMIMNDSGMNNEN